MIATDVLLIELTKISISKPAKVHRFIGKSEHNISKRAFNEFYLSKQKQL